jgi:DNA polymerase-3 subunit delta
MQIYANQLEAQLRRGLAQIYFLSGDEPLLIEECAQAIRAAAANAGFGEREVVNIESGFDWNGFLVSTRSGSLFSARRFIELRMPGARPGEAGASVLTDIAADTPADTLFVIRTGKLEKSVRAAKWVKALEGAGVAVTVYPLEAAQWPGWITRRLLAHGLKPGPGVAELLAYHTEGNLLAAAQEVEKLAMLFGPREIGADDIEGLLCDNARFNVFALADVCLRGEGPAAARMLNGLRAEGTEPALVLWALVREIRTLAQIAAEAARGQPLAAVLDAQRVWFRRKPIVTQAVKRHRADSWLSFLSRAARVERVIKGRARGDAWQELECLALAVCGIRLRTCGRQARVA